MKEHLLFGEEDFAERMEKEVKPWLNTCLKEVDIQGADGTRLRCYRALHPNEKAAVVLCHGFCEFVGKYHEVMYYFYQMGYSVFFIEHRGHGFSQRRVKELDRVYVGSYQEYVEDLKAFLDQIVTKESKSKKLYLFAHSMGGAIGALFLEQYPSYFSRAVLSSPLMTMNFGGVPDWQVKLLVLWSRLARWNNQYVPGQHGFDGTYEFDTSSCLSRARYDYVFRQRKETPEYTTYGATYAWARASIAATKRLLKEAGKAEIPVLLLQAGKDNMVKPEGQEDFARQSKDTRLVKFPESKHEIFNATDEIREAYYQEIFGFYES